MVTWVVVSNSNCLLFCSVFVVVVLSLLLFVFVFFKITKIPFASGFGFCLLFN